MTEIGNHHRDFVAGQLASFSRLGALRDFDLDFLGAGQVFRRDAKTTGGHLLDRRARIVPIFPEVVAFGVFAAFAGVGLAANAVHGNGQTLVRFGREGA